MEAITCDSGSESDPFNVSAPMELLENLKQGYQTIDLEMFNVLAREFIVSPKSIASNPPCEDRASPSTLFFGFELGDADPVVKAYFMPAAKAAETGRSKASAMTDALARVRRHLEWPSLQNLMTEFSDLEQRLGFQPLMVAADCVEPRKSRLKIYVRSDDTSFEGVRRVMKAFNDTPKIDLGLEELKLLWHLIFALDSGFDETQQLPHSNSETSGMLYYIEVRPVSTNKTVKIYLPVKHYAPNDEVVVNGLCRYLEKTRGPQGHAGHLFVRALREISQHRRLEEGRGVQTYLACTIQDGSLDLCSYINPEIYHPARKYPMTPKHQSNIQVPYF
ncbi:MAG: hypothetical protein Q9165_003994 [Trypethelium subeluteriae]